MKLLLRRIQEMFQESKKNSNVGPAPRSIEKLYYAGRVEGELYLVDCPSILLLAGSSGARLLFFVGVLENAAALYENLDKLARYVGSRDGGPWSFSLGTWIIMSKYNRRARARLFLAGCLHVSCKTINAKVLEKAVPRACFSLDVLTSLLDDLGVAFEVLYGDDLCEIVRKVSSCRW